ncbi:MAG: winged helix-turn-helix domain-containing protein [Campylobacterota bacterium]
MEVKVKVWIDDDKGNLIFGGGKTEVLKHIDQTGSISNAAKKVGMNYKKAWSHIKILEEYIEDELVLTQKGRGEDSGTSLTPKAREIIQAYEILQHDVRNFTKQRFNELFLKDEQEVIKVKEKEDDKA